MLYDCLKVLHILSATLLLMSMAYSYHLWKSIPSPRVAASVLKQIQIQTGLFIIPFAIIQLVTGFTMISIHQEGLSQLWIEASFAGYITAMGSWFTFIYFMLVSQQVTNQEVQRAEQFFFYRRIQAMLLKLCAFAVGAMIFFMANKVT